MEAELLRKLQETQKVEKDAFSQLEGAMIDASLPKKMRVMGVTSQSQQNNQLNQSNYNNGNGMISKGGTPQ